MAHALILGASGISGWSLVNQARTYPTPTTFNRITGTTNRPLSLQQAQLPEDKRLSIVSGIDLTKPVEEVAESLKEKIQDIDSVSHVFFTAYVQTADFQSLKEKNTSLLETAVRAIEQTFTEIRPDGIVGFTPTPNPMNMAQGIGLYLSIYRAVKGAGASVPFPGYEHGYHSTHSDTFQDILSKMEIYAALNPEKCGNGAVFNMADGKTVSWSQVWPGLCAHFGLTGEGPGAKSVKMEDFVKEHRDVWTALAHTHFMLVDFDFDRQYDLSRSREVGFAEEIDTVDGYVVSWERMRAARQLPPLK
ncbi:hypothetical protein K456DRAFT_1747645 [Colletotrichum gloeosporioides 23]|nr:hypothetical protein K456DRAFT_1747645 [Colletotrichum gloeosporioides 23]